VHEAHFGRPQSVPIGDEKERPITRPHHDPEQRAQFRLREEVNRLGSSGRRHGACPYAGGKRRVSPSSRDKSGKRS
jgi:hypothetical protein